MNLDIDKSDIEAKITFLTTEEGGRKGPVRSGYRGQFYYDGEDWDAVQCYRDTEWVALGQTVIAYLTFLRPQDQVNRLYPGKQFLIREGKQIVGKGYVTQILALESNAAHIKSENERYNALYKKACLSRLGNHEITYD